MNKILCLLAVFSLTSCFTLSLTNVSVEGSATDLIDQEQKQDGELDLTGSVPVL